METIKDRLVRFHKEIGITKREFERRCGFSNGYLDKLKDSPSSIKLERILSEFPQLDRVWLVTGEGPMLNDGTTITQSNVNGDNNVNTDLKNAINEIGEQRKITAKAQEQIDRLLAIIERLT